MTHVDLPGRILFLSATPDVIERQMSGADVDLSNAGPLRDDISTDEITPIRVMTHFDDELGRYPYVGFKSGDRFPIGTDAVKDGGFSVVVAGKRFGKGSSREHSPVAERAAGIRLVIAESFERIYRQNADNVGLFTSTDFSLIDRLRRKEPIDIEELVASRDALTAEILRCGGLLRYGQRHMRGLKKQGREALAGSVSGPMTLTEKILLRAAARNGEVASVLRPGEGIFVTPDWRFIHEYYTGMCAHLLAEAHGQSPILSDPGTIVAFEDHLSYAHKSPLHLQQGLLPGVRKLSDAHRQFVADHGIRAHGYQDAGEGSEGISHALMAETYAMPGQVAVGTDSHTPHSGALGCLAFGVGTTEIANGMVTGAIRLVVPETLRIELGGTIPAGVTSKDIALFLLADPWIRSGGGIGKVFEFTGSALSGLSTDERATLTNMTAEMGGFSGIVAPDRETSRFLKERRGIDFIPRTWMHSDPDASYAAAIRVDCSKLVPMVAAPGDPGNGMALDALADRPSIDIAYGGSCTAGKRDDFDHYHAVLAWAVENGLKVPPNVRLYLQFGTEAVRDYCVKRGYLDTFAAVGAEILLPACGACANCGPGSSASPEDVTVSAINRNFPGRSGPGNVWLASPPTVAASAVAGRLTSFDELKRRRNGSSQPGGGGQR